MEIAKVPTDDLASINEAVQRISEWKGFLKRQPVIKFSDDPTDINELKNSFYIPIKEPVFTVIFPKSLFYFGDYMTDDRKAEAGAIFMADGSVSIIGVGDEINEYDYSSAWHLISLATTGVKMTLPAVPTSDLLGIDEIKKLSSDFKTRLQGWVDLFSLIPGVKASLYNGDNPDNLIDLRIPSSCKHLISMQSDDYDDFYLEKDGSVCRCDYSEGEESEVYEEWLKDFDQEKETWASFYQKVVSLFKEYTNILPVSKE